MLGVKAQGNKPVFLCQALQVIAKQDSAREGSSRFAQQIQVIIAPTGALAMMISAGRL